MGTAHKIQILKGEAFDFSNIFGFSKEVNIRKEVLQFLVKNILSGSAKNASHGEPLVFCNTWLS